MSPRVSTAAFQKMGHEDYVFWLDRVRRAVVEDDPDARDVPPPWAARTWY